MGQDALNSFALYCDFGNNGGNTKFEKHLFEKKNIHTIKTMTFWVALRCLEKDSVKYRFLVWHYNKKCLCKIRKSYPVKVNMPICIYTALAISGYMLCG